MTNKDIRRLLEEDPDFVASKRFNNSVREVLVRYPEGAPAKVVAQCLLMTEEELAEVEESIIAKLRRYMNVEIDV